MMLSLESLLEQYDSFMSLGDERAIQYPLLDSPLPCLSLLTCYLLFVKVIGPDFMKNRKPFDLRYLMIAYNFSMVLLNGYIFWGIGVHGWFGKYDIRCEPVNRSTTDVSAVKMVFFGWLFYVSKFIEFLDTVFFILRKKESQVTLLHVIHHCSMPFNCWFTIRFVPGGHASMVAFVNSGVHVVMYSYYALSALGPAVTPYLFFKKYITRIQMIQFLFLMAHALQLLFRDCDFPNIFVSYIGFYAVLFMIMFSNFYVKSYTRRTGKIKDRFNTTTKEKDYLKNGQLEHNSSHDNMCYNNNEQPSDCDLLPRT